MDISTHSIMIGWNSWPRPLRSCGFVHVMSQNYTTHGTDRQIVCRFINSYHMVPAQSILSFSILSTIYTYLLIFHQIVFKACYHN